MEPDPFAHLPEALREWAPIYVAMARLYGFSQAEVDEMELWVIHSYLNPDVPSPSAEEGEDRMMTPEEFEAEAKRLLKQRFRAAVEGTAPPSIAG